MKPVVLATINARYFHTSLGLRCLRANLGPWRESTLLKEFILQQRPVDVVEEILSPDPWVVGLGVYIWNADLMREVVHILKSVRPDLPVVLGGPELIDPQEWPDFAQLADVVVAGDGEAALPGVLDALARGELRRAGGPHLVQVARPLPELVMPDGEYTDEDLAHRLVYVEASRGCSFACDFCLSAREQKVRRFDPDAVMAMLNRLWQRGARQFKFVDRALHLGGVSPRILEFFLERLEPRLFVHFEVVPEAIPPWAWPLLAQFPAGQLQLEAGVQSLDPETCARIGRPQNPDRVLQALRRLRQDTSAHLHTDLVLGLPGDGLASIESTFNQLLCVQPHEIQVGILKRLRGAPIKRHDARHNMRYSHFVPYEVLATDALDFATLQRLKRFARFFDLVKNSGNFPGCAQILLWGESPFRSFLAFSDWVFGQLGQTSGIAQDRLAALLLRYQVDVLGVDVEAATANLAADFGKAGKALPKLAGGGQGDGARGVRDAEGPPRRQRRHAPKSTGD